MVRSVEPYRDPSLPERFMRWIETLRQRIGTIPQFTYLDGSPEGVVIGQVGDLAFDRIGLSYYQKTVDGGNTGWVQLATGGGAAETLQQTYQASVPAQILVNAVSGTFEIRDSVVPQTPPFVLFQVSDSGGTSIFDVTTSSGIVNVGPQAGLGGVNFFDDGNLVGNTLTALAGALQIDNQVTGAGLERVLTTSDLTASFQGLGSWRYRTAITSTPGVGQMQFDNLVIDLATEMYVNVTNDGGTDMSSFLALIMSGDLMYVQVSNDATQFVVVQVDTPVLIGSVYTFPILDIEGQGSAPTNNTPVSIVVGGGVNPGGSLPVGIDQDMLYNNAGVWSSSSVLQWDASLTSLKIATDGSIYLDSMAAAKADIPGSGQIWVKDGSAGGDPLWSEVQLLADMDGTDGATTFTESSPNLASMTFFGNAQLDTAQFNSGVSSLLLDGTGDWATYPDIAAYDLGTLSWTIEGFVRFNTLPPLQASTGPGYVLYDSRKGVGALVQYGIIQDAFGFRVRLVGQDWGAEVGTISGGISINTWYHWAVTRDVGGDGNVRAYFNGLYEVADFGVSPADLGNPDAPIIIGCRDSTDAFMDGWIDDVRVTIGTARYFGTGAYAVPATPFPASGPLANVLFFTDDLGVDWDLLATVAPPVSSVFTRTGAVVALVGDYSAHYLVKTGGPQTCVSDVTINGGGGLIVDDPTINFRLENSTDLLMFSSGNTENFRISQSASLVQFTGSGFNPPDHTLQIQNFVGLDINVQTYFQTPVTIGGNSNPGSGASWNAPHGAVPSTPLDGDFWTTIAGAFCRINGVTVNLAAGIAPPTGTYLVTNVVTDRAYDANATTINELADVLGTLIADLQTRGILG